jgi:hypothetical protein
MPDMSYPEAASLQALQPVWLLRGQMRPPLSLGQQLPGTRELPVVLGPAREHDRTASIWRLSQLVDTKSKLSL